METTLIATARFHRTAFHPDQPLSGLPCKGASKNPQSVKLGDASLLEFPNGSCLHLRSNQFDTNCCAPTFSFEFDPPARALTMCNPAHLNIQDGRLDSVLFSMAIAQQRERNEKLLHLLTRGSSVFEEGDLNFSASTDLRGIHTLPIYVNSHLNSETNHSFQFYEPNDPSNAYFVYHQKMLYPPKSFADNVPNFSFDPLEMMHSKGGALFAGREHDMTKFLSAITGIYHAKHALNVMQRREMVVPYFRRSSRKAQSTSEGALNFQNVITPVKSTEHSKLGSPPKKQKKFGSGKLVHGNSYSQVCESLLSVVLSRKMDKSAFVLLKRNSNELFQLLTHLSASVAGTGLAVLFSVVWKLNSKVPFCTTRVLNTGFAFGLFWLSSSINSFRDAILEAMRCLSHVKMKEDRSEILERSVREVFLRAAAVIAIAILRFA